MEPVALDALRKAGDDLLVDIEVSPGSGRFEIASYDEWRKRLVVKVKSPPEKGKANREIMKEFSKICGKDVEIISGHKSRHKTLRIYGMDPEAFLSLLQGF